MNKKLLLIVLGLLISMGVVVAGSYMSSLEGGYTYKLLSTDIDGQMMCYEYTTGSATTWFQGNPTQYDLTNVPGDYIGAQLYYRCYLDGADWYVHSLRRYPISTLLHTGSQLITYCTENDGDVIWELFPNDPINMTSYCAFNDVRVYYTCEELEDPYPGLVLLKRKTEFNTVDC